MDSDGFYVHDVYVSVSWSWGGIVCLATGLLVLVGIALVLAVAFGRRR